MDLSAVSQAASEAGLNFTARELAELVQACRLPQPAGEEEEEEESRAEAREMQDFASSFMQGWTEQLLSAPVEQRWTAAWCERLTALLWRLCEVEAGRSLKAERAVLGDEVVDQELLSRYKRVIVQVREQLAEQQVSAVTAQQEQTAPVAAAAPLTLRLHPCLPLHRCAVLIVSSVHTVRRCHRTSCGSRSLCSANDAAECDARLTVPESVTMTAAAAG